MTKPEAQTITAPLLTFNSSPLGSRLIAEDYYEAYKSYTPLRGFSRAKYFLACITIELAAKTLHVDQGKQYDDLVKIGHNLIRSCDPSILSAYGVVITHTEELELKKANEYYAARGFEYYHFKHPDISDPNRAGPILVLSGYPNRPDLNVLETIINKLIEAELINT